MMRAVAGALAAWSASGQRAALATVVAVHGRAPLPVGSSLAVSEDGSTAGGVSGGCVEQEVARVAGEVLRGAPATRLRFAPGGDPLTEAALPCGGGIDVWVQPWGAAVGGLGEVHDVASRSARDFAARVEASETEDELETVAAQETFVADVLAGRAASLSFRAAAWGAPAEGEACTLEVSAARRLVLVGAGMLAGALCAQARVLGWATVVIDPRTAVAAHAPISDAGRLLLAWPGEALAKLPPLTAADAVLALSHHPALDDAALRVALRTEAGFIGAIGSRASHAERLVRLAHVGVAAAERARIVGPVGLDVGAAAPAEVAVAIVAELIAARNGRAGGRLAEGEGPVQARGAAAVGYDLRVGAAAR